MQIIVAKLLIELGRKCARGRYNDIVEGKRKMLPAALSLKGKAGWDSRLADNAFALQMPIEQDVAMPASDPCQSTMQLLVVKCPTGNKDSPSFNYKFQRNDLDSKIKCIQCSKCMPLRAWKCNCGKPWHVCVKHDIGKAVYTQPAAYKPPSIARKASFKKRLRDATFEQLLDDDLDKEAKRARLRSQNDTGQVISFDISPRVGDLRASMFSPMFRERFSSTVG